MKNKSFTKKIGSRTIKYQKSSRKDKKWMTKRPDGRIVHWGHPKMQDYTQHHDKKRRKSFRKRMSGIRLKNGSKAIDVPWSPAFLAYYVTW